MEVNADSLSACADASGDGRIPDARRSGPATPLVPHSRAGHHGATHKEANA
jgi:hypothetical protein